MRSSLTSLRQSKKGTSKVYPQKESLNILSFFFFFKFQNARILLIALFGLETLLRNFSYRTYFEFTNMIVSFHCMNFMFPRISTSFQLFPEQIHCLRVGKPLAISVPKLLLFVAYFLTNSFLLSDSCFEASHMINLIT